jgi:ribosomal protein L6P/L9E
MLLENTNLVAIQQNYRILNYLVKENNNTSPLFSRITNSLLLTKFLSTLYGSTLTLRLFGISFTAQYNPSELILKVGFSHTVNNFIPPNIIIRIKEDERKKPNIL